MLRDGDGDEIELVSSVGKVSVVEDKLVDPELQELEDGGGGYLSNSDDSDFLFGGDGDKNISTGLNIHYTKN